MAKVIVPTVLKYTVEINVDARGDVHFKCDKAVESVELVQHLQQVQSTVLNHFLTLRAEMLKSGGIAAPPHDFTGDDNGICTVCGKPANASCHVMKKA